MSSRFTTAPSRQSRRCRSSTSARADGGVRGRGDRPADQDARLRRADRRAGRDQRDQRDHHRPLQWVERGGARRTGARLPLGVRQPAGVRPSRRCSRRSPSEPGPSTTRPLSARRSARRSRWRQPGTAGPVFLDVSLEALFGSPPEPSQPVQPSQPAQPSQLTQPTTEPPDDDQLALIAELLAASSRPVLVLGSDVWLGRADVAARAAAEEHSAPRDRQRPGPRHPPSRTRPADDQGPVGGLRRGRPGDRRRHSARLPARLRRVRGQERHRPSQGRARRRRPEPDRHPPRARRHRRRRPDRVLHRPDRRRRVQRARPGAGRPTGCPSLPPHARPRSPATPRCWPATRTRSTRCGSTGSWLRCSNRTPW